MAELSVYEQLMLENVNRARLDPNGEAKRLGISLNSGLAAGTLTGSAKQVLAPNELLGDSASAHSVWMLANNVFSHTGIGGSDPGDRMDAAGYVFAGSWTWGENIAWAGTTGTPGLTAYTNQLSDNLFKSPHHRENILNGEFRELGTGIETGPFISNGTTFNAVMAAQNFAASGSSVFVTGVAITDADGDDFYDIGEGRSGISVSIAGAGSDTTSTAGGYAAAFGGGAATVTFSGGDLVADVSVTVSSGTQNAKVDLVNMSEILSSASVTLGAGAIDLVLLGVASLRGTGNGLNNVILGNDGANILQGMDGNDRLTGDHGRDFMSGGSGRDVFDFNGSGETGKTGSTRDHITDFTRGADKVDLSTIDARTKVAGNQAFSWIAKNDFHKKAGELHYFKAGSSVIVEGDTNGDGKADFQIHLEHLGALARTDFIL